MIFDGHVSLCKLNAKTIVSKDKGSSRKHIAKNLDQRFVVRHFKLDGDVFQDVLCCDYLLLNDTSKIAYYIELKGGSGSEIGHAVDQVIAGERLCASGSLLKDY